MTNQLVACWRTGREPGADGVCAEHGGTECVVTVAVAPPLFECVIPGFQCLHGHEAISTVEWQPIHPAGPRPDQRG